MMPSDWKELFKEVFFIILIFLLLAVGASASVGIFMKILTEFAGG